MKPPAVSTNRASTLFCSLIFLVSPPKRLSIFSINLCSHIKGPIGFMTTYPPYMCLIYLFDYRRHPLRNLPVDSECQLTDIIRPDLRAFRLHRHGVLDPHTPGTGVQAAVPDGDDDVGRQGWRRLLAVEKG